MEWIQAIVLGVVQGLTEFLPISSSAHLRIVGALWGADPGATFTAITQLGTETAVLVYFWRDIVRIITRWFQSLRGRVPKDDLDARMGWYIILGSIPIVILGVLLKDLIRDQFRSLWFIGWTLILFGILLGVADVLGRRTKTVADLSTKDGLIYGAAQALALIPGVSRSGGTITAGRLLGYDRASAARYSFLLAIPAVFGAGLYEAYSALTDDTTTGGFGWGPTILATLIAGVVGWAVIRWFLRYLERGSFVPFVLYRIGLGTFVLILLSFGVIAPLAGGN